tara:strand:+ start:392 stop:1051 length:660 start_codon:yes stop_codon:yes gene_type:complete
MRLNLSKIILIFTLLFVFDISAEKKIPLLEKDLYLKGNELSLNARSNKYTAYDILIHIYNDYDEKTRDLLKRCEERYQENLESYGKSFADSVMSNECMQDYEKSAVLSDLYAYSTDTTLNRNLFKKLKKCETRYYGDGNEFIDIRDTWCERYYEEKTGSLKFDGVLIQRDNLLTTFKLRGDDEKFEITFVEREEYEKLYQQLEEKHQAYMKKIEGESLL